jgi:glycosyltransferase involved in cell wall biosynthesis
MRAVTEGPALDSTAPEAITGGRAPMRLLHVHSGNLWGGVETVLVAQASERARCAHVVPEFALCFDGRLRARLIEAGVAVHDLGAVRWRSPLTIRFVRRRLASLLRARPYEAVVIHSMWAHGLFAPVVRRASMPLVHWSHDHVDGRHWLQRVARRTRPDLAIANSTFTAEGIRRVFPATPASVIHYPLALQPRSDRSTARAIRASLGTKTDATVIVQASRLEPWKGHETLLAALEHLRGDTGWECWIVGGAQRPKERTYLAALRRRAVAASLADRVRFLGHRDDVPDILSAADVFCQPNASPEPFGIVLVEALAAGLPAVAAATGGACEIVDTTCGELVPAGDAAALAEVLRSLIRDPERRRRLGARGPVRAAGLCDAGRQLAALAAALEPVCRR